MSNTIAWLVDFQDGGKNLLIEPDYYNVRGKDFEKGGAKLIPLIEKSCKVEFNINNYVEFELIEYGAKILNGLDELYASEYPYVKSFQNKPPKVEGEKKMMQFWDVISTFGEHTSLGLETFCKNAIITLNIEN